MSPSQDRMWLIERISLGEAPKDIELTNSERELLHKMQAENTEIIKKYPPAKIAQEISRRAHVRATQRKEQQSPSRTLARAWIWGPSLAAVCGLLFIVTIGEDKQPSPYKPDSIRLKGSALSLYKKTTAGSEALISGDRTANHDRIQIGYRIDTHRFGMILSIDGRGIVTVHAPTTSNKAVPMEPGTFQLPFSYELDDAPLFERFFLILSPEDFEPRIVVQAAEQLKLEQQTLHGALDLPAPLEQLDVTLLKDDSK
ncbi:MAG: hypothetical protein KTR25_18180 [Myxococcales bacterium]|nr:hypothetical protein [Myxococcales bacterium]